MRAWRENLSRDILPDISVYSWYKEVPDDVNLDDALKEAAADSDKIIADSACNVKDSKSYTYFSWTVFREGTEFAGVKFR